MAATGDSIESYGARLPPREWPAAACREIASSFAAEADRYFLWAPVFIAIGVAIYFAWPSEPQLWTAPLALAVAGGSLWSVWRRPVLALTAMALLAVAVGYAAAVCRAERVAAPVLERAMAGDLTGNVLTAEKDEGGALRAIIELRSFAGLPPEKMPQKVRLNIRVKNSALRPGAVVELRARLMPPPEPVLPHGFDFARQAWFEGIGAVGFAYTAPREIEPPEAASTWLASLRMAIGDRVRGVIGGTSGAVAAALINGERASIPDDVSEELRASGIYHVLSISGLHMVLFAGSLFWAARLGLALIPNLALRYPIKKWAAGLAVLGGTFYLAISGAEVATQRAWIMISLAFIAVLMDRPAISLRNVMLAAILILLWRPESLIGASFQMSFAAVIALTAFYESSLARRWMQNPQGFGGASLAQRALLYVLGIAVTSIIAGLATGAIAAFHFNRVALYGLAGNMGAMPIVGVIVMPMALLALIMMPFGLDAPALWLMGEGVDAMLAVSHEVASWGGADRLLADAPFAALTLTVLGGLWLSLWRERWRLAGLVPIVAGLLIWGSAPAADILIDRDAALFAARGADGKLVLTSATPGYTAEQWLRHDADDRRSRAATRSPNMNCDRSGCIYAEPGRPMIAFAYSIDAVVEDCREVDIVIARVSVPRRIRKECGAGLLLDYFFFWRNGATTIRFNAEGGSKIITARDMRGDRPWVQRTRRDQ